MLSLALSLTSASRHLPAGGPPPLSVSIASGSGYAGSQYYASEPGGQWHADGTPIAGATAQVWAMTPIHEGLAIDYRTAGAISNAIKMWTIDDIPSSHKSNGGWWAPRKSVQTSDGRITGVPDQWGVRNLSQTVVSRRPFSQMPDGHSALVWPNEANECRLDSLAPFAPAWWLIVMQLRTGIENFEVYEGLIGDAGTYQPVRVAGSNGGGDLFSDATTWTNLASVNAGVYSSTVAPLAKSLVELRGTPAAITWRLGIGSGYSGNLRSWRGPIWETIALGIEPTGDLLARIQGCIAHQQGIAHKLPSGHPYRTQAPKS